jgi:hypothetical protein
LDWRLRLPDLRNSNFLVLVKFHFSIDETFFEEEPDDEIVAKSSWSRAGIADAE